ncbi:uncharacterized protein LOC125678494 isoform X2 [Ostrea edulis]|uniref:uncharacterized protein LOC125678494 isoform X2 n=1 Tax=Ostrea edulis TaxID=37623 RepID=UPI0024AF7338|nr:uncharacterized protein LOC125678494 isoform X2 [Ostrea edulis]
MLLQLTLRVCVSCVFIYRVSTLIPFYDRGEFLQSPALSDPWFSSSTGSTWKQQSPDRSFPLTGSSLQPLFLDQSSFLTGSSWQQPYPDLSSFSTGPSLQPPFPDQSSFLTGSSLLPPFLDQSSFLTESCKWLGQLADTSIHHRVCDYCHCLEERDSLPRGEKCFIFETCERLPNPRTSSYNCGHYHKGTRINSRRRFPNKIVCTYCLRNTPHRSCCSTYCEFS